MKYGIWNQAVLAGETLPDGCREISVLPDEVVIHLMFERAPETCRASFAISDIRQFWKKDETPEFLDSSRLGAGQPLPPALLRAAEEGRMRAVNRLHPRWEELLNQPEKKGKKRLNLLALGDVGGTLLTALTLLGGETLSSIGICDLDRSVAQRWEMELGQVAWPGAYDRTPEIEVIEPDRLFEGDAFVFCASRATPAVGEAIRDVRMAQYEANSAIVATYARMARQAKFQGLFAVVSDPVDPLCRQALYASNCSETGKWDGQGLFPEQIRGYGLGVMNARAAYYAKKDSAYAEFLTEGRAYGPHGQDLVIANSTLRYDDSKSRALTQLAVEANLCMRKLGFKPYVAPALSSGAISLLLTLQGQWNYSSVCLGDVFLGCRNRQVRAGQQTECLPLPPVLFQRIQHAYDELKEIKPYA